MTPPPIRAGQLLELGRAASPQFATRTVRLRVVRELADRPTYHGWTWIAGYELDARGDAIDYRELYVLRDGMRRIGPPAGRSAGRVATRVGAATR